MRTLCLALVALCAGLVPTTHAGDDIWDDLFEEVGEAAIDTAEDFGDAAIDDWRETREARRDVEEERREAARRRAEDERRHRQRLEEERWEAAQERREDEWRHRQEMEERRWEARQESYERRERFEYREREEDAELHRDIQREREETELDIRRRRVRQQIDSEDDLRARYQRLAQTVGRYDVEPVSYETWRSRRVSGTPRTVACSSRIERLDRLDDQIETATSVLEKRRAELAIRTKRCSTLPDDERDAAERRIENLTHEIDGLERHLEKLHRQKREATTSR